MALRYATILTYVERLVMRNLRSSFVASNPLLYFMAGSAADNLDRLGNPKMGVILGGANLGQAQRQQLDGSYNYQFRFQKDQTDVATAVTGAESTPVASKFADDNVALADFRWTNYWCPLKVRQSRLDAAKGDSAIGSIVEEAFGMAFQQHVTKMQSSLWTGTLTESQQDSEEWADHIGLTHIVDDGTTTASKYYGGQDRTQYQHLKANLIAQSTLQSAGVLTDKKPTLSLLRTLRISNTYGGLANKNPKSGRLVITTPDLWEVLAKEAESKHTIYETGQKVPGQLSSIGVQYPVIVKDTTMITYDPSCPSGELYLLTPESFVFQVQSGANFKAAPWQKKWEIEEGGGYYSWTNIHSKTRLMCLDPFLQTRVTGLTVSGS